MKTQTILKKIISIKSVSGNEQKLINFILKYAKESGLPVFKQNNNAIFHFTSSTPTKTALIFNAHLDTVSDGDVKKWKTAPYGNRIKIKGDRIYGLGASDNKSGVASLILLAKKLHKLELDIDVWITLVTKEETDGDGTKTFLKWFFAKKINTKYSRIAAVICEPTGLKHIQIGHKGNVFLKIKTFGRSGHSSEPKRIKKHAVLMMMEIVKKIQSLEKQWKNIFADSLLGVPTIGLTTSIAAGNKQFPNQIPATCEATFDIRTTPKIHDKLLFLIKNGLKNYSCSVSYMYEPCPFGLTDKNEKIVKLCQKIFKTKKVNIDPSSSDLCFFTQNKIPTVVFGSGNPNVVHKENEYCNMSEISLAIKYFLELITKWNSI